MTTIMMGNKMTNPFSAIKNTRQTYSKSLESVITEVQVQFVDEEPTWIPYTTLLAIQKSKNNMCL